MAARIIDGRAIARGIEDEVRREVAVLAKGSGRPPRLDAVLVGDDDASRVYVGRKAEAAARVGIRTETHRLPNDASLADVGGLLDRLAADPDVDGILLQLPLPTGLDPEGLVARIPPEKDVDCFHPANVGAVALGRPRIVPCTPQGVLEILDRERVTLRGSRVVIVNHSTLVGRPLALLLLHRDATVTVCHKFTKDLAGHTRAADVLVSATGVPGLIGAEHVKPGAVVIDVGIARGPDGSITGDVRFDEVAKVAGALTPVPGGVGPLTIAVLLRNVVTAHRSRRVALPRVGGGR